MLRTRRYWPLMATIERAICRVNGVLATLAKMHRGLVRGLGEPGPGFRPPTPSEVPSLERAASDGASAISARCTYLACSR